MEVPTPAPVSFKHPHTSFPGIHTCVHTCVYTVHTCVCIYVYIYVYISLSPKTVRVTCIDLVVLIVTCSSLRVSQRLLILIMKNHGRCVNVSKDHLKHSGRNFNYGHSTVLCTCIMSSWIKMFTKKKKKKFCRKPLHTERSVGEHTHAIQSKVLLACWSLV